MKEVQERYSQGTEKRTHLSQQPRETTQETFPRRRDIKMNFAEHILISGMRLEEAIRHVRKAHCHGTKWPI